MKHVVEVVQLAIRHHLKYLANPEFSFSKSKFLTAQETFQLGRSQEGMKEEKTKRNCYLKQ